MSQSPGTQHQRTLGALVLTLYDRAELREQGMLLRGCGVVLSPETLVVPDLLFVSSERRGIVGEQYIEGPPDLLTEVISPCSDKIDRVQKRDLYAKYGVRYSWVAHPLEEWLRAYELSADGQYELVAEGHGDMTFSAPPFPDLTIRLARLWEERVGRIAPDS